MGRDRGTPDSIHGRNRPALALVALFALSLWSPALAWSGTSGQEAAKPSVKLAGGIYLYYYDPTLAGVQDYFEVYTLYGTLNAKSADGRYGLHVDLRARDSKLRQFFTSNLWVEEAYAWTKTPVGELRAGKFYRRVGIFWDDSFFGDIQYFNGLKLNPDFGVELVGQHTARPPLRIDYSLQFFTNNDHVAGSLDGRDVESDPNARLRDTATIRLAPRWTLPGGGSLTFGLSGLDGRIERFHGQGFALRQAAADLTLELGPSISYVEWLKQRGELDNASHPGSRLGYDDATYWLIGTRWQVAPRLNLRVNYSRVRYVGAAATEQELVPGLVYQVRQEMQLIVEYDSWKTKPIGGPTTYLDKSFNFVIYYGF